MVTLLQEEDEQKEACINYLRNRNYDLISLMSVLKLNREQPRNTGPLLKVNNFY